MGDLIDRAAAAALAEFVRQANERQGYVCDLDDVGAEIAAENSEPYTQRQGVIIDGRFHLDEVMRAVLQAVREPTEAMIKAAAQTARDGLPFRREGYGDEENYLDGIGADCWGIMIDAELKES
jgi:hypothetical protein